MSLSSQPNFSWFVLIVVLMPNAAIPDANGQQAFQQVAGIPQKQQTSHPLDPALQRARASLQHIQANIDDYTALFVKRYRVDGELTDRQFAKLKVRNRKLRDGNIVTPMSVYLDFLKPASVKGREVVWVENQNEGKLIAHDVGIRNIMNVHLDPNGYIAMRGQRHPITEIGIENLVRKLIQTASRDRKLGDCRVQIKEKTMVGKRSCTMLQVIHPEKHDHFDFFCARMFFDESLNMPILYDSWSWPTEPDGKPVLEEEYSYLDVKVNVGLTDRDFSIDNPEYRF